jgi:hypothetical protein
MLEPIAAKQNVPDRVDSGLMIQRDPLLAPAVAIGTLVLATCGGPGPRDASIADLVPVAGEVEEWAPITEAQIFESEELFELINGGAEIYHEFGFRQALAQDFTGPEQRLIALEVFEMNDSAGAYGTYSFKSSGSGRTLEIGDEAMLEDYYLNFRAGPYVVTLTGMSDDEITMQGITRIARATAQNIQIEGEVPAIVAELMAGDQKPERLHYLRGELAVANAAPFTIGMRLGMTEGAAARFSDRTDVMLRYPDAQLARQQFAAFVDELGSRAGWTVVEERDGDSALLDDGKGSHIKLAWFDDTIMLVVSKG